MLLPVIKMLYFAVKQDLATKGLQPLPLKMLNIMYFYLYNEFIGLQIHNFKI